MPQACARTPRQRSLAGWVNSYKCPSKVQALQGYNMAALFAQWESVTLDLLLQSNAVLLTRAEQGCVQIADTLGGSWRIDPGLGKTVDPAALPAACRKPFPAQVLPLKLPGHLSYLEARVSCWQSAQSAAAWVSGGVWWSGRRARHTQ